MKPLALSKPAPKPPPDKPSRHLFGHRTLDEAKADPRSAALAYLMDDGTHEMVSDSARDSGVPG